MSWQACTCWVLRCDGCGAALAPDLELHFSTCDPADADLVANASEHDWTTDGELWHCDKCPALRTPVCLECREGRHALCEDPVCACGAEAPLPGQGRFPLGEAPDA